MAARPHPSRVSPSCTPQPYGEESVLIDTSVTRAGVCRGCGREVALDVDGRVVEHDHGRRLCPGVDLTPVEGRRE